ncbi:MAG: hypothetical protein EAX96_16020 [Candidatus Lokiarchaeota archaeon]|nr:hypothetical protein [Candidatus Lokiarchaeota archaeon]
MSRKNNKTNILRKSILLLTTFLLVSTMAISLFFIDFVSDFDGGRDSNEILIMDEPLSSNSLSGTITLTESAGLDRINEPVTVTLSSAYDNTNDHGNYDGTITFYDDEVGSDPAGWILTNDGTYGTIQVIAEHDGHEKVLELYDTSTGGGIFADINIDASGSTGVIEFHYAISSLPDYAYYNIYFYDSSSNKLFGFINPGREIPGEQHKFGLSTDVFYDEVYDSNGNNIYLDNSTFFKCKFSFNFTAHTLTFQYALPDGEYQYAYQDTSGLDYIFPLSTDQTTVDKVEASTGYTATNYYMWIDSLDFSWSDGYYPERINDLINDPTYHDSVRVYDGVTEIPSQTWNMITHAEQSFEDSTDWGDPTGWGRREPEGTNIEIIPNYYGWGKIAYCTDTISSDYFQLYYDNPTSAVAGSYTFLIMPEQTDKEIRIGISGDLSKTTKATIEFGTDGHFKVGVPTYQNLDIDTTYEAHKWYLITLEFNCTSDIMTVYINGIQKSQNLFSIAADYIYQFYISSYPDTQTNCGASIAWMDYSWASDYEPERYNYLKSCKITFLANVNAYATKSYSVTSDSTSQGDPGYPDMTTGTDYIDDGLGGRWYLETTTNIQVMGGTSDPNGNFMSAQGTDAGNLQLYGDDATGTRFMDKGPIFCQAYRTQTGGYAIVDVYASGIARARVKDDSDYCVGIWGLRDGVGAEEHHYKTDESWSVRDPITDGAEYDWTWGIVTSNNYDGRSLFNNDGESWILATLVDVNQAGTTDFHISAYTAYGGGHVFYIGNDNTGPSLPANTETEIFWAMINSTANNDAQQRIDVENLYSKLINNPLIVTSDFCEIEAPTGLVVQIFGTSVTLYWNLVVNENIDHYNIYRSSNPISSITSITPIASVNKMTGSYTDSDLTDGVYYYAVTAVDDSGQESLVSNNVRVEIIFTRWIIIIIIIIFGVTGGGGATVGVLVYKKRQSDDDQEYKPKEYKVKEPKVEDFSKPKRKYTKQLDPDLIEKIKKNEHHKIITLSKLKDEKIINHELLQQKDFADVGEKISLISELLSLEEQDRFNILKSLEVDQDRLELMLNASLENIEIFKGQNKLDYLRNEYEKILEIAEKLGNGKLFERYKLKLEELEIEIGFD